jgi:mRNA interferase RelE/StbE
LAFDITFKKSVARDLRKIDVAEADRILDQIAKELPEIADSLPELKGRFAGFRKYRIGEYRVVFTLLNDSVVITRIRHRKEAYRD